jgi:hypothetical protein
MLAQRPMTLKELLRLARKDAVRVISSDGDEFIIAPSDTFEEEVARLGGSKRFMRFLATRSKNRVGRTLEEVDLRVLRKAKAEPDYHKRRPYEEVAKELGLMK